MSFAIRPTFKPRNLNIVLGSPDQNDIADQEEAQEIITAIQQFGQKSSHENLISSTDLQTILRSSSINPDINPNARKGVDVLLKSKRSGNTEDAPTSTKEMANTHGFSSNSVNRYQNGLQSAKLEKELEKELNQIRTRAKKNRGDGNDREIPDDVARQISAMRSSSSSSREDFIGEGLQDEVEEVKEDAQPISSANSKAKRALAFGYPTSASMARGFIRQGSMAGQGIKRTALGISDAF